MPSFDLSVSGVQVVQWNDLDSRRASRLNPYTGRTMLRLLGTVGVEIALKVRINGVEDVPDSALDGRLFVAQSAEAPHPYPVNFYSATGQSSTQLFVPERQGHYLVYVRRPRGGAVFAHIDVQPAT